MSKAKAKHTDHKKAVHKKAKKTALKEKEVKQLMRAEKQLKETDEQLQKNLKRLQKLWSVSPLDAVRWNNSDDVRVMDCAATPGFDGDKADAEALMAALQPKLADLQERLFASGKAGGNQSVLLVIQGLDTAGKGGIVRHVVGLVDPQGVEHHSFGVPSAEEAEHGYLWRLRNALPSPGYIGVFDRSQYEQVLVVRVDGLEDEATWRAHYQEINDFEAEVSAQGTKIIKVALMVSQSEQRDRLLARLDRPDKHWKYNPGDLKTRANFEKYLAAYQDLFERTNTDIAPWYVIPCDNKWYAHLVVTELLLATLKSMNLQWPKPDFDVDEQRRLLTEESL